MIDFTLTAEMKEMQEKARRFSQEEIEPIAAECDRKGETPMFLVERAMEAGLMNLTIPKEYGGGGYSYLVNCIVAEELAYGCVGVTIVLMVNTLSLTPLVMFGTAEQQEEFLKPMCAAPKLAAFCLTEPEAGSDAGSIKTTALADGDEYVINGVKRFITNGGVADLYTVFALTDPEKGARGASTILVPAHLPGVSITKTEDKMGQRASNTAEITFEDVRVPKKNLLGKEGRGFRVALTTLDYARAGIGALGTGVARKALDLALARAKERVQFGAPIIEQQAIQFMLADMAIKVETARLLTWKAAWLADQGQKLGLISAMAKCYAADVAMEVTTDAVQIFGGCGYMRDYPVEKLMRDAKLLQIYEGTNQIQRLVIARNLKQLSTVPV